MNGVFASSIAAVSSATDTLRNEVYQFGISVSTVFVGSIDSTRNLGSSVSISPSSSTLREVEKDLYLPVMKSAQFVQREATLHTKDISVATNSILSALQSTSPRPEYFAGMDTKMTGWLKWMASTRVLDWSYQTLIERQRKPRVISSSKKSD